jgi:peroxiredoxin family protein
MDNDSDAHVVDEDEMSITKFTLMFEPVEYAVEKTPDGYNVRYIAVDNEPESPRQCDNFGKMICFHGRYNLGDSDHGYRGERFNSWDGLRDEIERNEDPGVILSLYLYDHSGITMKTHPFNDIWDSGQVGFIFVSVEKIREEFSIENNDVITDEILESAKKILEGEVALYDCYLTGDVYRLVKEKFDKGRQQIDNDIVGGYYGIESAREELETF